MRFSIPMGSFVCQCPIGANESCPTSRCRLMTQATCPARMRLTQLTAGRGVSTGERQAVDLFENLLLCAPNGMILEQLAQGFVKEQRERRVERHANDGTIGDLDPAEDSTQQVF